MSKVKAQIHAIGTKTSVIIGMLILLYSIPLITLRQYYPLLVFNMFAEVHTENVGTMYRAFITDENGNLLTYEPFNPWPIRRVDIHNTFDRWVRNGSRLPSSTELGPQLISLTRKWHPNLKIKCYGIMQLRWPLDAPLDQRISETQMKKLMEYCDEK